MTAIRLTTLEQQALQQLTWGGHPFAALMYVLELRRRMDFRTFTVGDTDGSLVSAQFLEDAIERKAVRGSHHSAKKRDRYFVKRSLEAMVKVGLLERLPKRDRLSPMRFYFPLAGDDGGAGDASGNAKKTRVSGDAGLIRAEEERPLNASGVHAVNAGCGQVAKTRVVGTLQAVGENYFAGRSDAKKNTMNALILDTGNKTKYISNACAHEPAAAGSYAVPDMCEFSEVVGVPLKMRANWRPSSVALAELGLVDGAVDVEWHVRCFILYWCERGDTATEKGWDDKFVWYTKKYGVRAV